VTLPSPAGTDRHEAIIARSVHGLEWVCAWEACTAAGVQGGVELSRREVGFEVEAVGPGLLALRTADDVFLKLADVDGVGAAKGDLPALGRAAAGLDWERALRNLRAVRNVPEHGSFDVVASLEGRRSYNRFAVEKWIGLALAPVLGAKFLERDGGTRAGGETDITVRVFVRGEQATIAVRLGSRPLHRRAYKVSTGPGSLHPPVAAALAVIGAPAAGVVLDPFCGDGTIAIEAALTRRGLTIVASDIDPARVQNARQNARRADVEIDVQEADAAVVAEKLSDVDAIITNPPWNQAVSAAGRLQASGRRFWDSLSRILGPDGVLCLLTDVGLDGPELIAERGWQLGMKQRIRLAGRVADVSLAAPPGRPAPALPAGLADWRAETLARGVVTETGF
jgi:tRNA (guanine6-N2)-methyltransferase